MPVKAGTKPMKKLTKGMGLYQVFYRPQQGPKGKPYGLFNLQTGDVNGRWHATKESALAQARALYASLGNKARFGMNEPSCFVTFAENAVVEDGLVWVEALPAKTWFDPRYGEVPVTREKLENMINNFNENVRGQEVMTDYEHGIDPAKGKKASGTYRKLDIRMGADGTDSLFAGIELTPTARQEIENKEWKYFSLEWEDEWTHPETQLTHKDVIVGGGLTNRPVAKGMMPFNFSEVFVEVDPKEFAANKAPYGNVTYADPGFQADKKKRYPLDTERHIRAAWSYINMPKNAKKYTSSQLSSIKGKIRGAMKRIGANLKMAETDEAVEAELNANLTPWGEAVTIIENECVPEEFMEPGTDSPDQTLNTDDSYGNRIDTPDAGEDGSVPDRPVTNPNPLDEGGESVMTEEQLAELRKLLGVAEDADADKVLAGAKAMSEELEPLRELRESVESKKKFAEEYPDEAKRLAMLEERDQENFAKSFSESFVTARVVNKIKTGEGDDGDVTKDEPTTLGFSGRVINEIQGVAKEFSEGKPTFDSFKGVLDAIIDNGIVDYGNKGSELAPENDDDDIIPQAGSKDARTKFAEKVQEVMEKDEVDYATALQTAAKLHPKLAEAWRQPPVAA